LPTPHAFTALFSVAVIMSGLAVGSLEDMSPTDDRFLEATKNTDQVFPATLLERQAIEVSRSNVDEAFTERRYKKMLRKFQLSQTQQRRCLTRKTLTSSS